MNDGAPEPPMPEKSYLGDSVYASFDGYHIILTTENGLPGDPSNRIALEPGLVNAIVRYQQYIRDFYREEPSK